MALGNGRPGSHSEFIEEGIGEEGGYQEGLGYLRYGYENVVMFAIGADKRGKCRVRSCVAIGKEPAGQPDTRGSYVRCGKPDIPKIMIYLGNVAGDVSVTKVRRHHIKGNRRNGLTCRCSQLILEALLVDFLVRSDIGGPAGGINRHSLRSVDRGQVESSDAVLKMNRRL